MPLELDPEDFATLGWGDANQLYESEEWVRAGEVRRAQLLRAHQKYARSKAGREARKRYLATPEGMAANRKSSLSYYYRNKARLAQKAREWREKNPGYMAAKGKQYRERQRQAEKS